ncbi:MAG: ATP-binding protein [Bacillota bacterium]
MFILHRLRYQFMLLTIALAVLPLICTSYLMIRQASQGIFQEKEWWLYGVARQLDSALPGSFEQLLGERGLPQEDRQSKIRELNRLLAGITDHVAAAYPGVGVGYYSKDLDAIITYGPSSEYQDKVGLSIGPDHQGREVMATGVPRVQIANLVRGDIVNAMVPIKRGGRVIGYIWANVFTADVRNQVARMLGPIYWALAIGLLVALAGAALLAGNVARNVEIIKHGLKRLQGDPGFRFAGMPGEVGEIALAINEMVARQNDLQIQINRMERLAAVGELAAGLAHEIRNPLTGISGFAQCLERELPPGGELHQQARIITREVLRIERIIQELLNFARPRESIALPTDVNMLVRETVTLISPSARQAGVDIKLFLAGDIPHIPADSQQLKQVFLNLGLNAIQAMGEGGRLTITTFREDGRVIISFADVGEGIDSDCQNKIFDPFYTTRPKGTGLGLAISQRIVDMHGGSISVSSRPGEGTTVTVSLEEKTTVTSEVR